MAERPAIVVYLMARDAASALDFYVKGLGAEEIERWIDPANGKIGHAEFRINGQSLYLADGYQSMEAIGVRNPSALGGTSVIFWIEVPDLEAALQRALGAGATLKEGIQPSTEGGRRCRIADPAGHVWTLLQR
jgi:PhnB protein